MNELPEEIRSFLLQHPTLGLVEGNKDPRFPEMFPMDQPIRVPKSPPRPLADGFARRSLGRLNQLGKFLLLTSRDALLGQWQPHGQRSRHQLFCKLTLRHINKVPEHVLRHVQGRRYQRALKRYEECQAEGVEYVPLCLLQKKKRPPREEEPFTVRKEHSKKGEIWEPGSSEEEEDSDDSLSDLYPAELFSERGNSASVKGKDLPKQSERGVTMDVEEGDSDTSSGQDAGMDVERPPAPKRHQSQAGSLKKKFKSHHRKPKSFRQTVNGK